MSRLSTPPLDDVPAGARQTLEDTMSKVLDARTRHSIALAVSQANGCDYCLAIHTYTSSEFGGMSSEDIDIPAVDTVG